MLLAKCLFTGIPQWLMGKREDEWAPRQTILPELLYMIYSVMWHDQRGPWLVWSKDMSLMLGNMGWLKEVMTTNNIPWGVDVDLAWEYIYINKILISIVFDHPSYVSILDNVYSFFYYQLKLVICIKRLFEICNLIDLWNELQTFFHYYYARSY